MSTISGGDFLWGDGKGVNSSVWKSGDPDDDDVVPALQLEGSAVMLSGHFHHNVERYYVCENVSGK